jgi:hypothetical protein
MDPQGNQWSCRVSRLTSANHYKYAISDQEDTGLGGKVGGGQYRTRTKKMVLARFHMFLKSPMLRKHISFLRT